MKMLTEQFDKECFIYYDEEEDTEISIPATIEICPTCRGRGTRVNPNIDGQGLTREDFEEDPQFEEDYFSGVYDVACSICSGRGRILEVDYDRCNARQKEILASWFAFQEEQAYEQRMRSRGYEF